MNRYNGFDDGKCDPQFDDNSCKRHHPIEHGCTDREHSFCCMNCPPGPLVHRVRLDQEVQLVPKVFLESEARLVRKDPPV